MTRQKDLRAEQYRKEVVEQARDQYSDAVVDHWLHPRNFKKMDDPDGTARVRGACGDTMEISIRVKDGTVVEACFLTDGCITSIASGSMAIELVTGKSVAEVATTISQGAILDGIGGLPSDSEHCALLAAKTLKIAVLDYTRTLNEPWKRAYRRR